MTKEQFLKLMNDRLKLMNDRFDRFEEALRKADIIVRAGREVATASDTARRVGCSRATVFRIGKAHASARQHKGRALRRGMYNVEEVRRLRDVKPSLADKYLSKPRSKIL